MTTKSFEKKDNKLIKKLIAEHNALENKLYINKFKIGLLQKAKEQRDGKTS